LESLLFLKIPFVKPEFQVDYHHYRFSIIYAADAEGRIAISFETDTVLSTATLQMWGSQPLVEMFGVLCGFEWEGKAVTWRS